MMQKALKIAVIGLLVGLGAVKQGSAQTLVQSLNINLTAYDQPTPTTVKMIRITTKDAVRFFLGTNVPNAQLLLVTPQGNAAGTIGNLNAFLRITSGNTIVTDIPSPDTFNLFQDFASIRVAGTRTTSYAINRFSIDFGGFHAELQGFSTWSIVQRTQGGVDLSGSGSFSSAVNGRGTADGVTQTDVPMQGTITAGPPKPGT